MDKIEGLSDKQLMDRILREIDNLNKLFKENNIDQYNRSKFAVDKLIIEAKRRNLNLDKSILVNRILIKD